MKILQQTSTELTVGEKPPRFILGLFLASFLSIGLLFVFGILNSINTTFEIADNYKGYRYLMLAIGSTIILYGFIGFSSIARIPPNVICRLDKESNRMTIKYSDEKVLQHSLEEIADIRVEEWEDTYRVSFILISSESLPLTYVYSSSRKEKQQIADCIREFLG